MTAASNEDRWEQFTAEFPSDRWMRTVFGRRWTLQLRWAFFTNFALYFVGPSVFGSDVGMANAHEKIMRVSLNPVRLFRGYPYVVSYLKALQDDRMYAQLRRELLDATLYDAVSRLRYAVRESGTYTVQVPLISEGVFQTAGGDGLLARGDNEALAKEFLAFIDENGADWGMASWKIVRQMDEVYLVPKPEYWEARTRKLNDVLRSAARHADTPLK